MTKSGSLFRGTTGLGGASLALLVVCLTGVNCDGPLAGPRSCTLVGCSDQFVATVIASTTALPAGTHTVTVTTEAGALSCSFVIPLGVTGPACQPGIQLFVGPNAVCVETVTDGGRSLRCDPVADQIRETITVPGTPRSLRVQQTVAGATILDEQVTPSYLESRPNGPGCDPLCRGAAAEWTIR